MGKLDSGVKRYIMTQATVTVGFPVSWRDSTEIACKHCRFFERAKQRCWLTQDVVNYPDQYVGDTCPLEIIEEEGEENV